MLFIVCECAYLSLSFCPDQISSVAQLGAAKLRDHVPEKALIDIFGDFKLLIEALHLLLTHCGFHLIDGSIVSRHITTFGVERATLLLRIAEAQLPHVNLRVQTRHRQVVRVFAED